MSHATAAPGPVVRTGLPGRPHEVERVTRLVRDLPGRGGALLVTGEPGIGKTTLLDVARHEAEDHGALVVGVTGVAVERHLPFAALQRVVQPLGRFLPGLADPQRAALLRAVGDAGRRGSGAHPLRARAGPAGAGRAGGPRPAGRARRRRRAVARPADDRGAGLPGPAAARRARRPVPGLARAGRARRPAGPGGAAARPARAGTGPPRRRRRRTCAGRGGGRAGPPGRRRQPSRPARARAAGRHGGHPRDRRRRSPDRPDRARLRHGLGRAARPHPDAAAGHGRRRRRLPRGRAGRHGRADGSW